MTGGEVAVVGNSVKCKQLVDVAGHRASSRIGITGHTVSKTFSDKLRAVVPKLCTEVRYGERRAP